MIHAQDKQTKNLVIIEVDWSGQWKQEWRQLRFHSLKWDADISKYESRPLNQRIKFIYISLSAVNHDLHKFSALTYPLIHSS
jgi:hypothetical protein